MCLLLCLFLLLAPWPSYMRIQKNVRRRRKLFMVEAKCEINSQFILRNFFEVFLDKQEFSLFKALFDWFWILIKLHDSCFLTVWFWERFQGFSLERFICRAGIRWIQCGKLLQVPNKGDLHELRNATRVVRIFSTNNIFSKEFVRFSIIKGEGRLKIPGKLASVIYGYSLRLAKVVGVVLISQKIYRIFFSSFSLDF